MAATLRDIAEKANLSLGAVSRIVNNAVGDIRISPATEKRVLKIAKRLNYQPNIFAKGLKSGKSGFIGVVLPDLLHGSSAGGIFHGIEDFLIPESYTVLVRTTGNRFDREEDAISFLLNNRVEGIILASTLYWDEAARYQVQQLERHRIPMVLMGEGVLSGIKSAFAGHDDLMVGYLATRHLIQRGHESILCLTNTKNKNIFGVLRLEGYKKALQEAGLEIRQELILDMLDMKSSYEEAGYTAMLGFFKSRRRCSAVFAHCDRAALGVVEAARESGLSVPGDLAVVGVDNEDFAEFVEPSLTTLALDGYGLGRALAGNMLNLLKGREAKTRLLKPRLIVRESSGEITG